MGISNFREKFLNNPQWLLTSRHLAKIANYSKSCTPISEKRSTSRAGRLRHTSSHFEDTHLANIHRIERLFAKLTITFLWAYLVGIFKDEHVKPIRLLNNDKRAVSFFKYGLDTIANILLNPYRQTIINIFEVLSCVLSNTLM